MWLRSYKRYCKVDERYVWLSMPLRGLLHCNVQWIMLTLTILGCKIGGWRDEAMGAWWEHHQNTVTVTTTTNVL